MQFLLRIGQVSKLYGISLDTLRYYDRIGLLKPIVNKDNEYRYYSLKQLDILEMILVGKYMEIPLQQMQKKINSENISEYLSMMREQKNRIIDKKKQLDQLEEFSDNMIKLLSDILEFRNDYTFKNVTFEEVNKTIYQIQVPEILKYMNYAESIEEMDAIELWTFYRENSDGTFTNIDNDDEVCFSFSPTLPEPHILEKQLELAVKKNTATSHRNSGCYGKVSFWGSHTELLKYLNKLCRYFHLQDTTLSINYQFSLPCETLENLYFVDIYFAQDHMGKIQE